MNANDLRSTWEMLAGFKKAILDNEHWSGREVQAVAMGLTMISQMEGQYRVQMEMAERTKGAPNGQDPAKV